jgi:hypothetical protein
MDKQPDNGTIIIQIDTPNKLKYFNEKEFYHYRIGILNYDSDMVWLDYVKWRIENDMSEPDFWWCYADVFFKTCQMKRVNDASTCT